MASQLAGFVFTLLVAYTMANSTGAPFPDVIYNVDFLVGTRNAVTLYHSGDNFTFATLMLTSSTVFSVDYHFSKNLVFATTDSTMFKTTLEPQRRTVANANAILVKLSVGCPGFAVDWVHDRIYWVNCGSERRSIMACGLDGEAEQTVLSSSFNGLVQKMEIDPYRGIVFWVADWVIMSVKTSGEGFNPGVTEAGVHSDALALDRGLQRVYYVVTSPVKELHTLYSMSYSGSEKIEHFSSPKLSLVFGLNILGDKVFWDNYYKDNVTDVFYEAPLNLTRMDDVKVLRTIIDEQVWHMRVMHPSLQRQPKIDPCLDKGCDHSCIASGANTAKCECPPGQALNHDGVSCHAGGMFFLSILLIVAVMMTSLVCLGYKYWSLLQRRFGIPYSRSRA